MFIKYTDCYSPAKRKAFFLLFVTFCIFCLASLSACTPKSVYLDKNFNPPVYFGQHVVRKGDTLYSIAWRYGREMKELAAANNLSHPYVIQPGQKISLEKSDIPLKSNLKSSQKGSTEGRNVTERKEKKPERKYVTKDKKSNNINHIIWQWPHVGPILAKYSVNTSRNHGRHNGKSSADGLNKGVDIAGELGSPIFAAADGEVVYAGSGLLGYGNLVIINHNETYLSAYAHNRKILVREGEKVTKGRKIAEMGSSGSNRVMLHFEIRRDGKPVDPLKYLPKR